MALFVDLGDEESEPPQDFHGGHPVWRSDPDQGCRPPSSSNHPAAVVGATPVGDSIRGVDDMDAEPTSELDTNPNQNATTRALGCYPIIVTISRFLDLNSLDNLSRTCRQVHADLLQYRKILMMSALRCSNEEVPVDPEETLRYRARAGNWYYMEDTSRTSYAGKAGSCARDLVSECRRCSTVVCRNCAIKPPSSVVLRDRHRRLCTACTKAPITELVKPPLQPTTPLTSEIMQNKICHCASEGVWLCQPCGRSIRNCDQDYKAIWKWRGQYGERLGGLGTGIGDGDRGVPCGREGECHGAKGCEHETDCDAADAAADNYFLQQQQQQSPPTGSSPILHHNSHLTWASGSSTPRTPESPRSGGSKSPGYARHEVEGIGGRVKTVLVRMVKVGAGVPEWEDELARGQVLGREVSGTVRSWCGWCHRVIPGQKDVERDLQRQSGSLQPGLQEKAWQPSYSSSLPLRSR
ncbi:hypothetical protein MCOR25_006418 [Pyricularia grisea]|uniref:Uncharacterized protein n=1 Tax=Pyricularia grisea TaxID=148305 RepID=A0A6P8B4L2_PYRGI|nr:hypothetical protein PgNI_05966 [Pyricularia grisea]KAI6361673.1 hypothetical protein MCOR25_006418 [Pyricularia grisea]TLD10203.1 hypothetical protein PgNI_05966 [Pyricularia grisea]